MNYEIYKRNFVIIFGSFEIVQKIIELLRMSVESPDFSKHSEQADGALQMLRH